MAKFLNTQGLSEWIPRIIDETDRELVIITPYMQLSDKIYKSLVDANLRGVETIIVYRETKLSDKEKTKLLAIDNLNLMHHPNLHAKCYYNEKYLLIASMNLYEFSEKNNREMGVLLHKVDIDDNSNNWSSTDDDEIFKEALFEIKSIIKSSELEKESRETIEEGFEMDILKTEKEKTEEYCKLLNKHFGHKKFEAIEGRNDYEARCNNYFDKIDVAIESRVIVYLNFDKYHLEDLHQRFKLLYNEFMFDGFKFYWNANGMNMAYLYKDNRNVFWKSERTDSQTYSKIKEGINQFIQLVKPMMIQK